VMDTVLNLKSIYSARANNFHVQDATNANLAEDLHISPAKTTSTTEPFTSPTLTASGSPPGMVSGPTAHDSIVLSDHDWTQLPFPRVHANTNGMARRSAMCRRFIRAGKCKYGDRCFYAHNAKATDFSDGGCETASQDAASKAEEALFDNSDGKMTSKDTAIKAEEALFDDSSGEGTSQDAAVRAEEALFDDSGCELDSKDTAITAQ